MPSISDITSAAFSNLSVTNITSSLISIEHLITGCAYLMGVSFAVKAIYSMRTLAESKTQMSTHGSMKEPLIYVLVAAMLIYLPSAVDVVMTTTFGEGTQILAYAPVDTGSSTLNSFFGQNSAFGSVIALVIQVVGVISFIRGWVLISRSASQGQPPGGTGKGLMHIFGGILAMNVVRTLQVINNTLFGS